MAPDPGYKHWSRGHSVRNALSRFYKLGHEKLHETLGHSQRKRRYNDQYDSSAGSSASVPTSTAIETNNTSQSIFTRPINDPLAQNQVSETVDPGVLNELSSYPYDELMVPEFYSELPSDRFSTFLPLGLHNIPITIKTTDACNQVSHISNMTEYVTSEQFATALADPKTWGADLKWPMQQNKMVQSSLSAARPGTPSEWPKIRIPPPDVGASSWPSTGSLKSSPSISPSEELLSSPSDPEILSNEPLILFHQHRSIFREVCVSKYAQLTRSQVLICQEIGGKSPEHFFSLGWEVVEGVLKGHLLRDFWSLFSLIELAFACGQVIWESEIDHQIDELLEDLKAWSYTLKSPHEQLSYQKVIEIIFANKDYRPGGVPISRYSPAPVSTLNSLPSSPLSDKELLNKLQNGTAIRLCLQFLSTFEFLQNKFEHKNNVLTKIIPESSQAVGFHIRDNSMLAEVVVRPLSKMAEFYKFRPVLDEAIDLLYCSVAVTSRQLELFLICHARYLVKDYKLHSCFQKIVMDKCSHASRMITGTDIDRSKHHLQDINAICQLQGNSVFTPSQFSAGINHGIQELQGTPMAPPVRPSTIPEQVTVPLQNNPSWNVFHPEPGYCQLTQLVSSTGLPTPSTGTSSKVTPTFTPSTTASITIPPIDTPMSVNFISPANTMDTNFTASMDDTTRWSTNPEAQALPADFDVSQPLPQDGSNPMLNSRSRQAVFDSFNMPAATVIPDLPATTYCSRCPAKLTGTRQNMNSNLRRHMKEAHSGELAPYKCKVCQQGFKRKHAWVEHMQKKHS